MTQVALLRHFPTAWNGEQRLQGRTDVPLCASARESLGRLRLPPPWDAARRVSSHLARAAETARLLSASGQVQEDPRLAEISFGAWEGRRAVELLADREAGFRPTHLWGPDCRAPGGESLAEAWGRVAAALADIAAGPAPAVIVTHKGIMRLILRHAGVAEPEIKRARLYPLTLDGRGIPGGASAPVRLEAR